MTVTKAGSKAGRLKARRGRRGRPPIIPNRPREPNGRISRARSVREPADRLALVVRARQLGVSVEQARDPRLATYIGRLNRLGKDDGLSYAQYQAALTFLQIRNNWLRAIGSPAAHYEERIGLSDEQNQEEAVKRDKARYEAMRQALKEAQFDAPHENLYAALQYLVIDDLELPHMVGTLRLALNALDRHFCCKK